MGQAMSPGGAQIASGEEEDETPSVVIILGNLLGRKGHNTSRAVKIPLMSNVLG